MSGASTAGGKETEEDDPPPPPREEDGRGENGEGRRASSRNSSKGTTDGSGVIVSGGAGTKSGAAIPSGGSLNRDTSSGEEHDGDSRPRDVVTRQNSMLNAKMSTQNSAVPIQKRSQAKLAHKLSVKDVGIRPSKPNTFGIRKLWTHYITGPYLLICCLCFFGANFSYYGISLYVVKLDNMLNAVGGDEGLDLRQTQKNQSNDLRKKKKQRRQRKLQQRSLGKKDSWGSSSAKLKPEDRRFESSSRQAQSGALNLLRDDTSGDHGDDYYGGVGELLVVGDESVLDEQGHTSSLRT